MRSTTTKRAMRQGWMALNGMLNVLIVRWISSRLRRLSDSA